MAHDTPEQTEFLNLSIADDTEIVGKNPWKTLSDKLDITTYRDLLDKTYFELSVTPGLGCEGLAALLDQAAIYGLYKGEIPRTIAEARKFHKTEQGRREPLRKPKK